MSGKASFKLASFGLLHNVSSCAKNVSCKIARRMRFLRIDLYCRRIATYGHTLRPSCTGCVMFWRTVVFQVSITVGNSPKYTHYDPYTHLELQCDQCPPGTCVRQDCTAEKRTECAPCPSKYFTNEWNSFKDCQYCSTICKELQTATQECSSTGNRICECIDGYFLDVEFCSPHKECPPGYGVVQQALQTAASVPKNALSVGPAMTLRLRDRLRDRNIIAGPTLNAFLGTEAAVCNAESQGPSEGTPDSDTICSECPKGMFSNVTSSTAPCQTRTNCRKLGRKVLHKGSSTHDAVCKEESAFSCEIDVTLCEEALFRFPTPPENWIMTLIQRFSTTAMISQQINKIREIHNPKEQPFYLYKLYKSHSQADDSFSNVIKDLKECEKGVFNLLGSLNLTSKNILTLMRSLPGKRVKQEDIEKNLKDM
ncbi:unnamed protein product [Ranitomeya imitator]|uniref:TNFR-Cys domain-containing protein n=1 Tax=Ranitomeya imitator TaxID=111125 RepID=A0ABN9L6C4_9NEOB|nr:unnamed protein product [Ranitomeya imitator]